MHCTPVNNIKNIILHFRIFLIENDFRTNVILILASFTYIIIVVDLQTELAIERNEITETVAALSQSVSVNYIHIIEGLNVFIPLISLPLLHENCFSSDNPCKLPGERAPPVSS
jgi:hypothetical protein